MPVRQVSVQRVVTAPAAEVFELLARPASHREIDGGGTVQGAPHGPERLAIGDEFSMAMRMGVPYRSTSVVTEFEEGRRIAWQTGLRRKGRLVFGGQVWRYELSELAGGRTLVRETCDLSDAIGVPLLARTLASRVEPAMKQTLERIATLVD